MITCWSSSQKQFYRFFSKKQDRKLKAWCRSPVACRVIISDHLGGKRKRRVRVASLVARTSSPPLPVFFSPLPLLTS